MPFFDIWKKLFQPFWIYFAWLLSSSFSSRGHMVWKMFFEEFHDGCLMLSRLWYHNGMTLEFCVTYLLAAPIKFLLKRIYGLEDDDVWIIPRWLFSAWPSSMCGWGDCSYSEWVCCLTHPTMFMLNRNIGWKRCCLKNKQCLLSSWPSLISEWNDFIYSSLHVAWCLPSSFCSRENIFWKKLFENFQEGCLLHDHLWYLSGMKEAFQSK